MYNPPKNLTEQMMNLCERLAIEMRIVANSLKNLVYRSDWDTLKALAFKDTVSVKDIDLMNPSPKEVFNAFMGISNTPSEPEKENNNGR